MDLLGIVIIQKYPQLPDSHEYLGEGEGGEGGEHHG